MPSFTDADLRRLAGDTSYRRGVDYVDSVGALQDLPDGVAATVVGMDTYRARLYTVNELVGECSCPYGQEGNFCKHCVAVGLRVLGDPDTGPAHAADVRAYLDGLPRAELVEHLWTRAGKDPGLYTRLRLAASVAGGAADLGVLRAQVARLRTEWLSDMDVASYLDTAEAVIDTLAALVDDHAAAVQPLLRDTIRHLGDAAAIGVDDGGEIGEVAVLAWETYVNACVVAPPDQAELAAWMLDLQLNGPDQPEITVQEVLELLDPTGLAVYRAGLDAAAQDSPRSWRLKWLRESLTAEAGDTDALVACLAEDLTGAYQYERIAELLLADERVDDAIDWLERGPADGHAGESLVATLRDLYGRTGRHADALALSENHFATWQSDRSYSGLREAARAVEEWDSVRARAHAVLHEAATETNMRVGDLYARILLDEDDIPAAWSLTQRRPCTAETRLAIAARRATTHPGDAVDVYESHIEAAIDRVDKAGYARAAKLLDTARPWYLKAGRDFAGYLDALRDLHKRKRNLLAAFDARGLR